MAGGMSWWTQPRLDEVTKRHLYDRFGVREYRVVGPVAVVTVAGAGRWAARGRAMGGAGPGDGRRGAGPLGGQRHGEIMGVSYGPTT
jgi:hypothetical protein